MKRLLILIAAALLAVILLMLVKNECARWLPSAGNGMAEIIQKQHVDYLFIGSSTFRRGLDIEELQKLSENTYILSYNGNQPVMMWMILEYLIQQGVTVDHLFVDFYPYMAAAKPALSDTSILIDTDLRFKFDIWKTISNADPASSQDLQNNISTFYELFISANNATILWWPIHRMMSRRQNFHGGLRGLQNRHGSSRENLEQKPLYGLRDGLQASQMEGYRNLIETAQKHGIELCFIETPKYRRLYDNADYRMLFGQIWDALAGVPGFCLIPADQVPLDRNEPDYFNDLVHLSGTGAHTYTQMLLDVIRIPLQNETN